MLVKHVKKEHCFDPANISQLPDALPYQLQQLRSRFLKYECITINKYLQNLEGMWNILDYEFLCYMTKEYGNQTLKIKCEKYKNSIEKFCSITTISDLLKYWTPRLPNKLISSELKSCILELSWDPKTKKLKDVKEIQHKLEDVLPQEITRAALCLFYINAVSSVIVVWFVLEEFLNEVMTSLKCLLYTQPEFIKDNEITYFSLDETILFTRSIDKVSYNLNFDGYFFRVGCFLIDV